MTVDPDFEVLDGDPGELWRPPRWVLVVVALVILVSSLAWYADQQDRARESDALAACRQELQAAAISSDLQMMAVATTIRPTVTSTKEGRHGGVAGIMSRSARQLLPAVIGADEVCQAVSVRPWHFSLRERRNAAAAYSAALAAKLGEVAADGRTSYVDDRSLRSLRRAADIGVAGEDH